MHTFEGIYTYYGCQRDAVFRIPTSAGDVFMRVGRTPYCNEQRAVVEVDRERFFALWKNEPSGFPGSHAHGNTETWRADRKFADADGGFSHGRENPVPLAKVNCEIAAQWEPVAERYWLFFQRVVGERESKFPYASFTNGITRTIWLTAHSVESFPVECKIGSAQLLHELAGTIGSTWTTVADLIPEAV